MNSVQRTCRNRTDAIYQVSDTSVTGRSKDIGNEKKGWGGKVEIVK